MPKGVQVRVLPGAPSIPLFKHIAWRGFLFCSCSVSYPACCLYWCIVLLSSKAATPNRKALISWCIGLVIFDMLGNWENLPWLFLLSEILSILVTPGTSNAHGNGTFPSSASCLSQYSFRRTVVIVSMVRFLPFGSWIITRSMS